MYCMVSLDNYVFTKPLIHVHIDLKSGLCFFCCVLIYFHRQTSFRHWSSCITGDAYNKTSDVDKVASHPMIHIKFVWRRQLDVKQQSISTCYYNNMYVLNIYLHIYIDQCTWTVGKGSIGGSEVDFMSRSRHALDV
jgi:hypothetical protein